MSQQDVDAYAAAQFAIRVREDPLRTWVTPSGELDLNVSDEFDRALWSAQSASRRVVLDLRALEFIDSAGLHPILAARLRSAAWRRHLEIISGSGQVRRFMALSGHGGLLDVIEPLSRRQRGYIKAAA